MVQAASEAGPHSQLAAGFDLIREERAAGFTKRPDTRQDKTATSGKYLPRICDDMLETKRL